MAKNIFQGVAKSHMITEKAYLPYFFKTTLAGKKAYLTKGMWEVKRDYMAGPFVNYMVEDMENKRWMVVEGFAFAPSVSKRDYMFELNSILTTLQINPRETTNFLLYRSLPLLSWPF